MYRIFVLQIMEQTNTRGGKREGSGAKKKIKTVIVPLRVEAYQAEIWKLKYKGSLSPKAVAILKQHL